MLQFLNMATLPFLGSIANLAWLGCTAWVFPTHPRASGISPVGQELNWSGFPTVSKIESWKFPQNVGNSHQQWITSSTDCQYERDNNPPADLVLFKLTTCRHQQMAFMKNRKTPKLFGSALTHESDIAVTPSEISLFFCLLLICIKMLFPNGQHLEVLFIHIEFQFCCFPVLWDPGKCKLLLSKGLFARAHILPSMTCLNALISKSKANNPNVIVKRSEPRQNSFMLLLLNFRVLEKQMFTHSHFSFLFSNERIKSQSGSWK